MRKLSLKLAVVVRVFLVCLMSWPSLAGALCVNPVAELVSTQGTIELNKSPARLSDAICPGDVVTVGPRSRAAIVILETDTVLRIDQDTELRVRNVSPQGASLLDLLQGAINLLTPAPRSLEITTPVVNAAVEGTEFYMRVAADRAVITVFEGRVAASNDFGSLKLTANESAVVVATQAPKRQAMVRPRDTVQWALYYPPIGVDETASPSTRRAAELLAVGRVDEAGGLLDDAIRKNPNEVAALALKSIIAVAQNQTDAGLQLAEDAVSTNSGSGVAHIALSYAQQANFRLDLARQSVDKAVELDADNAFAWARLSELWLSEGNLNKALEAADQAVKRAPDLARTQSVLGFAYLVRINIGEAKQAFENAIQRDQADPLPRLGLGLAKIRRGDLIAGRRDMEIAASLDPNNSLLRSYLGKAYFEERRTPLDARQFALAKELDPNDPTPWLYDAIRKQTQNRPVEALQDLQRSIDLNDNRAVYRSQLFLDQDLAARSAGLGRIYTDLGFEQRALVEGWKSVNREPGNFSGHRLLADTYATLPRHEIARVSELLQSQLLQPLNVTPLQPQLAESDLFIISGTGPSDPAFNEFNPLFARDRLALQANGVLGGNDTIGNDLVLSGLHGKISYSVGQFHFESEGFRDNNDQNQDIYNAFVQANLSPVTSIQAEIRSTDKDQGDLGLRFDPDDFSPVLRSQEETDLVRVGLRHNLTPGSSVVGSLISQRADFRTSESFPPLGDVLFDEEVDGYIAELQHLFRAERFNIISGLGYFEGDVEEFSNVFGTVEQETSDINHTNGYVYSKIEYPRNVTWTVGLSADSFEEVLIDSDELNPKFGATWNLRPETTIRLAAFQVLRRTLVAQQTIEPTQVAGFNQFFDDDNGTKSKRYGIAIDQQFSEKLYTGIELSKRELTIPNDIFLTPRQLIEFDWEERADRAYLYWTVHPRMAVTSEIQRERFDRPQPDGLGPFFGVRRLTTYRVPLGVNFYHPSGFIARFRAVYLDQEGTFVDTFGATVEGDEDFWVADLDIGYRLPKRRGLITIGARNLFDKKFRFEDVDPGNPSLQPERYVFARATLAF